jgi:hypothetical protein
MAKKKTAHKGDTFAMPVSEKQRNWEAESDARTLSSAMEIHADKPRYLAAVKEAKRLAKEKEGQAMAMRNVAERKVKK